MENNREKNKDLQSPAGTPEQAAEENATLVSLEDLMKDLPASDTDTEEKPVRKTETSAETEKTKDMSESASEPAEAEQLTVSAENSAEEPYPAKKTSLKKGIHTWLFRKPAVPAETASDSPVTDAQNMSSAAEMMDHVPEASVLEKTTDDTYVPDGSVTEETADAFAFVTEPQFPEAAPQKKKKEKKQGKSRVSPDNGEEEISPSNTAETAEEPTKEDMTQEQKPEDLPEEEMPDVSAREAKPNKPSPAPGTTPYLCRMVLTLTVICVAVAALLAVVNLMTKDVIAENAEKKRSAAILAIFPEGDTVLPWQSTGADKTVSDTVSGALYYIYAGGEPIGFCANVAPNGYGGEIQMMVGITSSGGIRGVQIVEMSETSGVGSKTRSDSFLAQYLGKSGVFTVGSNIDAIAGATISSKAVTEGVNMALALAGFVTMEDAGQYSAVDPSAYPVISLVPVETEPAETGTIETEPLETDTDTETIPPETETETETVPPETETETETVPPETETETETVPPETRPPETVPPETKPPETVPPETKPPETVPPETRPPETVPPETRPLETTPPETEPEPTPPETETETTPPETETETTLPETETETESETIAGPSTETETETATQPPQPSRPPVRH